MILTTGVKSIKRLPWLQWVRTASVCALVVLSASGQNVPEVSQVPSVLELDATGSGSGFDYQQLPSDQEVYVVTFSDTGEQVLVSQSFLSLMVQRNMPADVQRMALESYPNMVQQHFDEMMETTFPDQSMEYAEPFEAVESIVEDGTLIQIDPDPLATPYVRVTVSDPEGQKTSFSLNRKFVDGILNQENADGDLLLHAVTSFPFRLPESSRPVFQTLSREELTETVLKLPELQRQEIIQMPRFYRERAAAVLKELSNAVPHTVRHRSKAEKSTSLAFKSDPPGKRQSRSVSGSIVRKKPLNAAPNQETEPASRKSLHLRLWSALGLTLAVAFVAAWLFKRRKS